MSTRYAVILSGGSGTRLWPLSRALRPKQLLCLNGDSSLLQQTAARLLNLVEPTNLFTVTHQDHKFEVKGQLTELSVALAEGVLSEPVARNTLPAIAWAVHEISKRDPEAIIGVFPSDHAIESDEAFIAAWLAAELSAEKGYLTLIGLTPTEAATGYGYIQPGDVLDFNGKTSQVRVVKRFVEKPNQTNARKFVAEGFLWNGGMFVFRASIFMQMLRTYQPRVYEAFDGMDSKKLSLVYENLESLSVDYGIAEKAENVAVVPADMGWSDLGSWESIYQHQSKNEDGNLIHGDVLSVDTKDSLVWTTHGLLAMLGVSNLAVIQTPDATLVCDRNRTEEIKGLVSLVQQTYPQLTETHLTAHRPWGTYTILEEGLNFKIKRIVVNPGAQLSMQLHNHRAEHWVVIAGRAKITNGEREIILEENQSTYIPKGHKHRLANPESVPLQIIEVQCGDYVGEDDIVRFEDTYGRCDVK
jgi:mannose-1-phosphate guanylyltransferase/mannose-6-phosphate isomerase